MADVAEWARFAASHVVLPLGLPPASQQQQHQCAYRLDIRTIDLVLPQLIQQEQRNTNVIFALTLSFFDEVGWAVNEYPQ